MDVIMTERAAVPATTIARHNKAVWLVAAVAFAIEMAFSARYGYDRDELYFLAAGQHLAFGYVDQPPLTPLLARFAAIATGDTLVGLRAVPALGMAALVLLTAAMARALGADRRAELLAALATACCADYIGTMHELTTTAPDFVFWAATLLIIVKLLGSGNPRWWLAAGGCAGLGMEAKWNIGFLLAGLAAGFLAASAARPLLRSRWLLAGTVLFAALAAPDIVWQAAHGWPDFAIFHNLQQSAWQNRLLYWPEQAAYTSIVLVPLWIRGARWALRDPRYRAVGIAAVVVIVAQFVLGGKPYYPAGAYTFLFAAGAVSLRDWRLPARAAWYCAAAVIGLPASLPVLPAAALAKVPVQKINFDLGEEIGWPSQVALVARTYDSLPPAERKVTAVITGNYGEAGAIDRYGPSLGLPQAYSGDNNFWLWGPPPAADTTVVAVVVSPGPELLRRDFAHVREVAVFRNGLGVSDEKEGAGIYIATGLRVPWAQAWPAFRYYG